MGSTSYVRKPDHQHQHQHHQALMSHNYDTKYGNVFNEEGRRLNTRVNCLVGFTVVSILVAAAALTLSILLLLQVFEVVPSERAELTTLQHRVQHLETLLGVTTIMESSEDEDSDKKTQARSSLQPQQQQPPPLQPQPQPQPPHTDHLPPPPPPPPPTQHHNHQQHYNNHQQQQQFPQGVVGVDSDDDDGVDSEDNYAFLNGGNNFNMDHYFGDDDDDGDDDYDDLEGSGDDGDGGDGGDGDDCPLNPPRPVCPPTHNICSTVGKCPNFVCCS
ncbi:hypothetical protein Pmani_026444 [Petrolisthes manimaculis]|uniref:Uncharacterized protein n=1 Tax=Petrolisthes manimaculis TaxID=1843537 RepID=A0AAE1P5S7_9EUCA|nr:hypothetical protein Pmani_026444 [Petrolisthes manimaculis]